MDDDKLGSTIARGKRAELMIRDPLFAEAFKTLETDLAALWLATKTDDTIGRERIWQAIRIAGTVQSILMNWASAGRIAHSDLDRLQRGE